MKPDSQLLDEIVRRIVARVRPRRIVLFGSAARGEMGPNSDLDLLVEMPNDADRLSTAKSLYRALRGLGCAKDILVVLESDVELLRDNPYRVIYRALREGRELYHAAEPTAR